MTLAEWTAERERLFGFSPDSAKFVCPRCGNVASGADFKKLNVEDRANKMYSNCLGRFSDGIDCDWAAYGLFGTMGKGIIVDAGDKEVEVFDFDYSTDLKD